MKFERADVLVFSPKGEGRRVYASGIRNCVGMAVNSTTGDLWCSTNERDGLGDDLPPDYITRVREGGFYGWPWYYIGAHEDPHHIGARPDLKNEVIVPDILIQPHSASMQMMFYSGDQFPAEYKGNVFAAEHGSWNRAKRTGYKIIRGIVKDGVPTGAYEDFVTGFAIDDARVWGGRSASLRPRTARYCSPTMGTARFGAYLTSLFRVRCNKMVGTTGRIPHGPNDSAVSCRWQ